MTALLLLLTNPRTIITLAVGIVLTLVGSTLYIRYDRALTRADIAEKDRTIAIQRSVDLTAAAQELEKQIKETEAIARKAEISVKERIANEQRLARQVNKLRKDLADLRREDPAVASWADSRIPSAVLSRLRKLSDPAYDGEGGGEAVHPGPVSPAPTPPAP
jgi:hypothetical protein